MTTLPTRKIGQDSVPAIGFGAMGIGHTAYGHAGTDEERFKVLDRLLELGCTHWDTASVYGDSEELIGKWFAKTGNRDKIFLATKFGFAPGGFGDIRGDPEFVKESVNASLKKLQTDRIDLLYQHRPDGNTPIETTVQTMKEFVDQGKVRYLGLSEASPDTIRRAQKIHPISALQVEYSPWERDLEKPGGVVEAARELGIAIVAYSPVGRGLVTGSIKSFDDLPEDDFRRIVPKYKASNWPRITKLVDEFKTLGKKYNATPAQITLAWLLTLGNDIIPIPGSKQVKYVEENVAALKIKLEPEDVKAINQLSDEIVKDLGADQRYGGPLMDQIYRDTPPLHK